MRILQLAPLAERVPPPAYGGTEAVVSLLTDGLVRRGHQVTLFASGDSLTLAELRSTYPSSLRSANGITDTFPYEFVHMVEAFKEADEYDLIHSHVGELAMPMSRLSRTPVLSTFHNPLSNHSVYWDSYRGFFNTISRAAKKGLPDNGYIGVVYNAVDVASFPFCEDKDDYLLFLSRISPEKGTHTAIEVARRLGLRLIIAGKIGAHDRWYYEREIRPRIDGKQIQYLGEADGKLKRELYARARCLLLPITWNELFGLVMAEAMACGTPVIAFNYGAAPEIIVHGQTGFVVGDTDEMTNTVAQTARIDPYKCREHVLRHFDIPNMVDGYLAVYDKVLSLATHGHGLTRTA